MRRRGRGKVWKLLLPLPLAVSIVAIAGIGARRAWYSAPLPPPRAPAGGGSREPAATRSREMPRREVPDADLEPRIPPAPRAPLGDAPQREGRAVTDEQVCEERGQAAAAPQTANEIIGPAPQPVAPSLEDVLRASMPPPAVASAPSLAPAPVVPLVPAPEPTEPPRTSPIRPTAPLWETWAPQSVRAVRFDASYWYGHAPSARRLAEGLAREWAEQGVNLIYFYAYNPVYGARYRTRYAGNVMEDFGREDLLRHMIREAHRRDIRVIAWLNGVQHKQIWETHPGWREKTADGRDYKPNRDSYLLCVRNPEVMRWWLGFVDELLRGYPELDGIDLAECQVDEWGDNACYCAHCREQFAGARPAEALAGEAWREFRGEGLTRLLLATSRLAHRYEREVHVTTVFTARRDGDLMCSREVRDAIGFDLDGLLNSPDRPDVMQAELIWQQWAALYGNTSVFKPEWTSRAVHQAKAMVAGRARMIAHVEVTDFGCGGLDGPGLARTIACAVEGRPHGIDIYDAHQLEKTRDATGYLQTAWLDFGR